LISLVERWNGRSWSIQPHPLGQILNAVSCPSRTSCTAVGGFVPGEVERTLVERWNGRSWSLVRSPNPPVIQDTQLAGVWCTAPKVCTAVGQYLTADLNY